LRGREEEEGVETRSGSEIERITKILLIIHGLGIERRMKETCIFSLYLFSSL